MQQEFLKKKSQWPACRG